MAHQELLPIDVVHVDRHQEVDVADLRVLQQHTDVVAVVRREAEGVLQSYPLSRLLDETRPKRPENPTRTPRRPDADYLPRGDRVHPEQALADVLPAVDGLEPAAGLRLSLGVDGELPRQGVETRVDLLRPRSEVVAKGSEVCVKGDGLISERSFREDLDKSFLVELL